MTLEGGPIPVELTEDDVLWWRKRLLDTGGLVQECSCGVVVPIEVVDRILGELVAYTRRETARQVIDWIPERHTVTRNELRGKARAEWGP